MSFPDSLRGSGQSDEKVEHLVEMANRRPVASPEWRAARRSESRLVGLTGGFRRIAGVAGSRKAGSPDRPVAKPLVAQSPNRHAAKAPRSHKAGAPEDKLVETLSRRKAASLGCRKTGWPDRRVNYSRRAPARRVLAPSPGSRAKGQAFWTPSPLSARVFRPDGSLPTISRAQQRVHVRLSEPSRPHPAWKPDLLQNTFLMQIVHTTQRHAKPLRNFTPPKQTLRNRWRRPVRVLPLESLDYSISLRCANGSIHLKHRTNRLKSCIEHTVSNTTGPAILHHSPARAASLGNPR
jgi:hypothetical protein